MWWTSGLVHMHVSCRPWPVDGHGPERGAATAQARYVDWFFTTPLLLLDLLLLTGMPLGVALWCAWTRPCWSG